MKTKITIIALLLMTSCMLFSQNLLRIINPNGGGTNLYKGTITDAAFTVKPQGAYMEVGMFLTFSDIDLGYNITDTLEIILDFNLPKGSIINDSWLWMLDGTTIVRADILDFYTANDIYEGIVSRNQDPSILYQKETGTYQIRVFPLAGGGQENRQIKISYLTPATWSAEEVQAWLPTNILQTSKYPLDKITVITFPDSTGTWQNPRLLEVPDAVFGEGVVGHHDQYGVDVLVTEIPAEKLKGSLRFAFDAPFNADGVFAQQLKDGTDNFYQVAYMPPSIPVDNSKNILFLFDNNEEYSEINRKDVYEYAQEMCYRHLEEGDKMNMYFSRGEPDILSDEWLSIDQFDNAFSQLSNPIALQSKLKGALENSIDFIKENGGDADIVLVANSIGYNSSSNIMTTEEIEEVAAAVMAQIGDDKIRIHIVNYTNNTHWNWWWNDNNWWSNVNNSEENYYNKQLYQKLTSITGGQLYDPYEGHGSFWENLSNAIVGVKSIPYNYDLSTSLGSGFTFDRYHQTYAGQSQSLNKPILQIGKYTGNFPLELEFSALIDSMFVYEDIEVSATDIVQSDSLNREIWYGHYIPELETLNNASIQDIIDISIEERILSRYTAFLALDITLGAEPCIGCWGTENILTVDTEDILDEEELEIQMTASPNPFEEQCMIEIDFGEEELAQKIDLLVFDAFGKRLLLQELNVLNGKAQWAWDGKNEAGQSMPTGIYFLVAKTDKGLRTLKLNLMK